MPAHEHETAAILPLDPFGEIDHFRQVGKVVQREADGTRPECCELAGQLGMGGSLQVEDAHFMARLARRLGNTLQAQRLEAQIDLAVHEGAGMHEEKIHANLPSAAGAIAAPLGHREAQILDRHRPWQPVAKAYAGRRAKAPGLAPKSGTKVSRPICSSRLSNASGEVRRGVGTVGMRLPPRVAEPVCSEPVSVSNSPISREFSRDRAC